MTFAYHPAYTRVVYDAERGRGRCGEGGRDEDGGEGENQRKETPPPDSRKDLGWGRKQTVINTGSSYAMQESQPTGVREG